MGASTLSRLSRLDALIGLLRTEGCHTVASLAQSLNISTRTCMRDLDVLREKGYPIESDQGRGGGIRLHWQWEVGRLNLDYREVIDLLLALNVMQALGSPIFLQNLESIRNKLSASFPPSQRARIQPIRNRILFGHLAGNDVLETIHDPDKTSAQMIYEAFFELKKLRITYNDSFDSVSDHMIEPHYLFLNWPAWYVLAWDHLGNNIRCFRLCSVAHAQVINEKFKLRDRHKFIQGMEEFISKL